MIKNVNQNENHIIQYKKMLTIRMAILHRQVLQVVLVHKTFEYVSKNARFIHPQRFSPSNDILRFSKLTQSQRKD